MGEVNSLLYFAGRATIRPRAGEGVGVEGPTEAEAGIPHLSNTKREREREREARLSHGRHTDKKKTLAAPVRERPGLAKASLPRAAGS